MTPRLLFEHLQSLIGEVLPFRYPAESVVSRYFRAHRELGARDRAALSDTVYAVIRRKPFYQHLARSASGSIERRLAIVGWQGDPQVRDAALAPEERQWLETAASIDVSALAEPLRHNLPMWLAQPLKVALGDDFWALVAGLDRPAPLDLRVNTFKAKRNEVQAALSEAGIESEPTPYSPLGLRIKGKPALHHLPVFVDGSVEVQDEGSQILALLVGARRGEMVVDFCAGAGGKTLALGALMRNTGRLYAWDTSAHRLDALKPRLARSGLSNIFPAALAHEKDERVKRLFGKIDRVLVDAPCSGVGTLRRNPDLKWRQNPAAVQELAIQQGRILEAAARLLKPGGRLVYATCSLLQEEDEAIADAFSHAHADFHPLPMAELLEKQGVMHGQSLVQGQYLRLWPHRNQTDGFFAAAWERSKA